MNIKCIFVSAAVLIVFLFGFACVVKNTSENEPSFPDLTGEYLGQEPPGTEPVLFAPGIISTGSHFAITFLPDGKECFYTRTLDSNLHAIITTKEVNSRWTEPEIVWFSGTYDDLEPHITPDGSRLYYGSTRPFSGEGEPIGPHQWYLEKTQYQWFGPTPLESPLRDIFVMYVSVTNDNTIYFTGQEDGDQCVCLSRYKDGNFQEPEKLSDNINFRQSAAHPFIAPDESYIIYDAVSDINSGSFYCDLYVSFRNQDGTWTISEPLGNNINTTRNEICAFVSRDGKYLFFSRNASIYWVDAGIIQDLKPGELKNSPAEEEKD